MSLSDSVADFLTRVRNGQKAMMKIVIVPFSKMNGSILQILLEEGFIKSFTRKFVENSEISFFEVVLKYYNRSSVINFIVRISKPGKRVYTTTKKIPKFYSGLGIFILSTSKGVITDSRARELKVGGEILCGVF